jgi:RNA polymerase sigma-70 factor (ECF subfamily)
MDESRSELADAELSNEELLARVAAGDHRSFELLYQRTASRVLAIVRRQLVDFSQSEEVTQEVFLEVWQQAARFASERGKAASWILTIASRRAIDRVRASQASRDRDAKLAARNSEIPHDQVWERIESEFASVRLHRALERITPLQREAVTVSYLHGRTAAEAAAVLGASEPAVRERRRAGLVALRTAMLELGEDAASA